MIKRDFKLNAKRTVSFPKDLAKTEIVVGRRGNQLFFCTEAEWLEITQKALKDLKGSELRRKRRILFKSVYLQDLRSDGRVFIPRQLVS